MTTFQQAHTIFDAIEHDMPREEWPSKIGILEVTFTDSIEQTQAWTERASKDGFEVVSVRKHGAADTDFTSHIEVMKAAGVDMLLGYPTPPQGVTIMKQMSELDFHPKVVCLIRAPNVPTFGKNLGSLSDYVLTTVRYDPALPFPGNDRLNAVCQDLNGRPPNAGDGLAYAACQILANAIERAGTLDKEKVRDAISATDMMTVMGPVTFDSDGRSLGAPVVCSQWYNQEYRLTWPKEAAGYDLGAKPLLWPK